MRRIVVLMVVAALATTAWADWDPIDGHKMHYPQLPDLDGWDIRSTCPDYLLADDWQCSQTGLVSDIHIWLSSQGDQLEPVDYISAVNVRIYSDIPAAQSPTGYSMPGAVLREWQFDVGEFTVRPYGQGSQGWLMPENLEAIDQDHVNIFQLNIDPIIVNDPFTQNQGEIYWLSVELDKLPGTGDFGWKTSLDHFNDDAVVNVNGDWTRIWDLQYSPIDPPDDELRSLAFVITPEPGTMALLALGGLALLKRRRS